MKFLNGQYYVEKKDHRYIYHPTENIILRLRDIPQSLRTQYQVLNNTQIRRNQKLIENIGKFENKKYPKRKQPVTQHQQLEFKQPN